MILENVDEEYSPKEFKEKFIEAFNEAIKGTYYNNAENSTSAITIKVVDRINKRIVHSCDFAITSYVDYDLPENGYDYIRNLKNGIYQWVYRDFSKNSDTKLKDILDYWSNGWEAIKEEYLKLKCKQEKHSLALYFESINNVYNWMLQDKRNG